MVAKKKATSSSQSSSSHPVALTQAQQNLVDEIKSLGRLPKRKKGSSPDDQRENKLAKRFYEHKKDDKRFYDHLLEELQQLQADKADEVQEDKADALCLCNLSNFCNLFHFLCVFAIVLITYTYTYT